MFLDFHGYKSKISKYYISTKVIADSRDQLD